jgi:hypothetical protein
MKDSSITEFQMKIRGMISDYIPMSIAEPLAKRIDAEYVLEIEKLQKELSEYKSYLIVQEGENENLREQMKEERREVTSYIKTLHKYEDNE